MFPFVDSIVECNNARIDPCLDPQLPGDCLISSTEVEAVRALSLQLRNYKCCVV